MPDRIDVLDQAIEAILAGATEIAIPRELEPLVAIAAELRELPDPAFKRRLGGRMSTTTAASHVMDVIPYLVAEDIEGLIAFVTNAYGAELTFRTKAPSGGTHSEVRLAGRRLMMGGGMQGRNMPGAIHLFVPDVDATYRQALDAGATSLYAPMDQEYEARDCAVRDAFGNEWYIGTKPSRTGELMAYFHPVGAESMVAFLENALGGEVVARYPPAGTIAHMQVKLGKTVVELGEAHGQWQPIPMMLMVTVDNADAAYERAIAAGAKSLHPPQNAEYGRVGAVEDPAGNQWYLTAEK